MPITASPPPQAPAPLVARGLVWLERVSPAGVGSIFMVRGTADGVAVDPSGNAWVLSNGGTVTRITAAGEQDVFPVGTLATGLTIDAAGGVWVANGRDDLVVKL